MDSMKLKSLVVGLLLTLALVSLAACGEGATPTPVPQINQVGFSAFDYGFNGPETIPAGMTTITMVNEGQDLHHQQLIRLPEGMSVEDLVAAFAEGGPEAPPPPGSRPPVVSPYWVPE